MPHPLLLLALATLVDTAPKEPLTPTQPWTYRWQLTLDGSVGGSVLTGDFLSPYGFGDFDKGTVDTYSGAADVGVMFFLKPLRDETFQPRELQPFLARAGGVWANGGATYFERTRVGSSAQPFIVGRTSVGAFGYPMKWLYLAVDASFDRTTSGDSSTVFDLPMTNLRVEGTVGVRARDVLVTATYRHKFNWKTIWNDQYGTSMGWGGVELGVQTVLADRWALRASGRIYDYGHGTAWGDPPEQEHGGGFFAGAAYFITPNFAPMVGIDYRHDHWLPEQWLSEMSVRSFPVDVIRATAGANAWLNRRVGLTFSASLDWSRRDNFIEGQTLTTLGAGGDVRVNIRL